MHRKGAQYDIPISEFKFIDSVKFATECHGERTFKLYRIEGSSISSPN